MVKTVCTKFVLSANALHFLFLLTQVMIRHFIEQLKSNKSRDGGIKQALLVTASPFQCEALFSSSCSYNVVSFPPVTVRFSKYFGLIPPVTGKEALTKYNLHIEIPPAQRFRSRPILCRK